MENQHTQQQETLATQAKKGNCRKHLPMAGLVLVIIATAFAIILLTKFGAASTSRVSTPSEIAAQNEFHDKWNTAQEEFQHKVDAATKEAEQISNSLVDTSTSSLFTPSGQKEFHDKLNTAEEEFQQKVNAATKEAEQKSDSFGK